MFFEIQLDRWKYLEEMVMSHVYIFFGSHVAATIKIHVAMSDLRISNVALSIKESRAIKWCIGEMGTN